jgi:GMP synthase (glutamine-hydrolysing)
MARMKPVVILRHVPFESLGNLETILGGADVPLHVVECFDATWPDVERGGFDARRLAGLVVMGGPMNVDETDRFGFLATEVKWLAQAADAGLPTLGICLGAQLLAKALGATVYKNQVQEIGWYDLELLRQAHEDALFAGSRACETVFQWHGDTFDLPPGAVSLARTATCEQQAFRYGGAYGIQFHLEMTAEMVEDWLSEPEMCGELKTAPHVDPLEIHRQAPINLAEMAPLAHRVFGRFAGMCHDRARRS